jgi:hypothetical protein
MMKIQILYFEGCPTYGAAEEALREVLGKQGRVAEVERIAVNTDEEAQRLRFPGSPTIRVNGHDLFPVAARQHWRLGCRVYTTPEGLRGCPAVEMIGEALTAK